MRIGVLGTGDVGRHLGSRLVGDGHEVTLGSRTPDNTVAADWAATNGDSAAHGTFEAAVDSADMVVNALPGEVCLEVLAGLADGALRGVTIMDVANPLDFGGGFPPVLSVCNTSSLAEQIQRAHPAARVVKTLNTMHHTIMVDPARLGGDHVAFICGDDIDAKQLVTTLLTGWGWPETSIVDLGDISNARGTEMYLALWTRVYAALGTGEFNIGIVR